MLATSAGHGAAGLGVSADALPVQVPSRAASVAGKSKFKSSPLGEGVIAVAEKANEDGGGAKQKDGGGDGK